MRGFETQYMQGRKPGMRLCVANILNDTWIHGISDYTVLHRSNYERVCAFVK